MAKRSRFNARHSPKNPFSQKQREKHFKRAKISKKLNEKLAKQAASPSPSSNGSIKKATASNRIQKGAATVNMGRMFADLGIDAKTAYNKSQQHFLQRGQTPEQARILARAVITKEYNPRRRELRGGSKIVRRKP